MGAGRKERTANREAHRGHRPGPYTEGPPYCFDTLARAHVSLTPSVKKLRSIRKLGTRFGRRLGSEDRE